MSEEYTDEEAVEFFTNYIDTRRFVQQFPFVPGGPSLGQTDWENRRLNDMLDMIDGANASDLQTVGDALKNAADSIRDIGEEITKYSGDVEWEGQSAEAFKTWALDLGKNTEKLATYTDYAGTQMQVAAEGLSSVKSSMPPRDPEPGPGLPLDAVPAPAQVEGNEKFEAAQKKEADRQEAINQMNRLSSYYKVTRDLMAAQEEPTFGSIPDVGVPDPPKKSPGAGQPTAPVGGHEQQLAAAAPASSPNTGHPPSSANFAPSTFSGSAGQVPAVQQLATFGVSQPVHTDLNSVALSATPSTEGTVRSPGASSSPAVSSPANALASPVVPLTSQRTTSQGITRSKTLGPRVGGDRFPASQLGGSGKRLPSSAGYGPNAMGRPPLSASPSGSGRSDGISGGRPQVQTGTPAAGGPRAPQGTVVGGERAPMGRAPMTGAAPSAGSGVSGGRPTDRRLATERGGSIGAPQADASRGGRPTAFTPGGTGLVQGGAASGRQGMVGVPPRMGSNSAKEENGNRSRRPDYLIEDESTWTHQRDVVPHVIE
ncbi:hypothetical protein JJV70_03625 [Streptomyces sp. JJ66]|uniref:hypothetical protein n=1 Tax=Streptomyces sp. JJ66 TaxID=2803843 RepID=UPI001C57C010|nr:hypothetical protein [Streptomyces sp. JJ66]MBW1601207.1 hypothetical protein [Streptomyces sp. JJ66]